MATIESTRKAYIDFVLNLWVYDDSDNFEKTAEAIEKGINVTFDLFQRSPIDNMVEYSRFLARKANAHEKFGIEIN